MFDPDAHMPRINRGRGGVDGRIYADGLAEMFTRITSLDVSLGRRRRVPS